MLTLKVRVYGTPGFFSPLLYVIDFFNLYITHNVYFQLHTTEFNTNCALHELYTYAVKYNEQLTVTLEEDEFSQKQRLAFKLEQVHNIMSAE